MGGKRRLDLATVEKETGRIGGEIIIITQV